MKLRSLGAGSPFCRWPLVPACWLIQTEGCNMLVGCPPQAAARLELIGLTMDAIDMIVPLSSSVAQTGGLDEFGKHFENSNTQPYLACPEKLLSKIVDRLEYKDSFQLKAVKKIGFTEEHITETFTFVDNLSGGYGFRLEGAKIFCSGPAAVNEDWIYNNTDCETILHCDQPELRELPMYLQDHLWIFGYEKQVPGSDPLPMLFLPQGSVVYDSDRRDKTMTKGRFLRENSKRIVGNEKA